MGEPMGKRGLTERLLALDDWVERDGTFYGRGGAVVVRDRGTRVDVGIGGCYRVLDPEDEELVLARAMAFVSLARQLGGEG